MIRAIIIDDERHAIKEIEFFLKDYPVITVIASYTNPLKAMDELQIQKPDLVFLDINMPQLLGIDAGSKFLDLSPDLDIVFITAYDQYAIEAFELDAIDYLLKPIQKDRFEKTILKVCKRKNTKLISNTRKLTVKVFGKFMIGWEQEEPIKWRTENTKQLFVYLLMNAGREMSKEEIIDTLWYNEEINKATKLIHNGIYYIRKILGDYGVSRDLININGNYCLSIGNISLDQYDLSSLKALPDEELELSRIEAIYQGDYLEGVDWQWTDIDRERYINEYIKLLCRCSAGLIQKKNFTKAEECLHKAYRKNPYEEATTLQLMKLYMETSQNLKAKKHFTEYASLLKEDFKIKPSKHIMNLYRLIE